MTHRNLGDFNILYFNINSLRNKLDDIIAEIASFEKKCHGQMVHFIALTETKIKTSEVPEFPISYYKPFFKCSPDGYGGVALYVHRSLGCTELFSRNRDFVNMPVVRIPSAEINIAVMYKSPTVDNATFFPILKPFLRDIHNDRRGTIIVGDINIDLSQTNRHLEYRNMIELHGFYILNKTSATRVGATSRTIIDHVLTNCEDMSHKVAIHNTALSDHRRIHITFD